MQLICSYCRADLGEIEPLDDPRPTHGMCDPCADHFTRLWEGLSLGEYLDDLPLPALVVEEDGRIIAANQSMAEFLGRSDREAFGLLGGEATGCVYARLPEGCGSTTHCRDCTVRNAVERARHERADQPGVPAWLDTDAGRLHMRITTRFHTPPDRVVLVIEHAKPPIKST